MIVAARLELAADYFRHPGWHPTAAAEENGGLLGAARRPRRRRCRARRATPGARLAEDACRCRRQQCSGTCCCFPPATRNLLGGSGEGSLAFGSARMVGDVSAFTLRPDRPPPARMVVVHRSLSHQASRAAFASLLSGIWRERAERLWNIAACRTGCEGRTERAFIDKCENG